MTVTVEVWDTTGSAPRRTIELNAAPPAGATHVRIDGKDLRITESVYDAERDALIVRVASGFVGRGV